MPAHDVTRFCRRHAHPAPRPPALRVGALAVAMLFASAARGAPTGAVVVAGQVQVSSPGPQSTVITQGTDKAIVNWNSFNVNAAETVDFRQPSASSVILNRVTGGSEGSVIAGRITANGKVFLVDPQGVLFTRDASVNVGSLVASNLAITDQNFLAGRYLFEGDPPYYSNVANQGQISAAERGTVALLGGQVRNDGTITARLGTIGLVGAGKVTLDFAGDGLTRITVERDAINALVANSGALVADGGDIVMRVATANAITDASLRNTGTLQAHSLVERNGRILLDGSGSGGGGSVQVGGTLDASAPAAVDARAPLNGGQIQISGDNVRISSDALIDARGDSGGVVRMGGVATSYDTLTDDLRGSGHAQTVTVDEGAMINAEARYAAPATAPSELPPYYRFLPGAGGSIALGATQRVNVGGTLRANGRNGGAGGTVIVAAEAIDISSLVETTEPLYGGNLVLRQGDFDVDSSLANLVSRTLNARTNVTLDATPPSALSGGSFSSVGNLNVGSNIVHDGASAPEAPVRLTLAAAQDLTIAPSVSIAASGYSALNVDLNAHSAGGPQGGTIRLAPGSSIVTNGGNVRMYGQSDPVSGAARGNIDRQADGVRIDQANIDTRSAGGADLAGVNGDIAIAGGGDAQSGSGVAIRNDAGANLFAGGGARVRSDGGGVLMQLDGSQFAAGSGVRIEALDGGGASIYLSGGAALRSAGTIDVSAIRRAGASSSGGMTSAVDLRLADALIESGRGLVINGSAGNGNGIGAVLARSQISTAGGELVLTGSGGTAGAGVSVNMSDSTIGANGGDLRIVGSGIPGGVAGVVVSSETAGGTVNGASGGAAVTGSTARLLATGGNILISGQASPGFSSASDGVVGTRLTGMSLEAVDGAVRIDGTVGAASGASPSAGLGLLLRDSIVATSGADAGAISLVGATAASAPGLCLDGVTLGGASQRADIVLGAANGGGAPVLAYRSDSAFSNAVQTAGAINVRASGQGSGALANAAAVAITVSDTGSTAPGLTISPAALGIGSAGPANLVVGSADQRGAITYQLGRAWSGDLTLQNGGAGSAGIDIASDLQVSGALTLSSGGTVSQRSGTRIVAPSLLLNGSRPESNFQLMGANSTPRFAVVFDVPKSLADAAYGDVNYSSRGDVTVSALQGTGFTESTSGSPSATTIASTTTTVVAGDLLLRAGGRLTLEQNVRTIGSDITLVAGSVFDNSGGHTLTPGADGNWRVFADTWRGENRGGLQASRPLPNLYNCSYGAACGNLAGNHFIYREQPLLSLQANPQSRTYGDSDPAFTYTVTGLVNGDVASDAVSGAYASTAGIRANAGRYPINGNFVSPAGYAISANTGVLTVTQAPLSISADDQRKVYGGADPLLGSSVSGLRNGDTLAQLALAPVLSTATGKSAGAGLHPIAIEGIAGTTNYTVSYRPGTLTVDPASLVVTANDQRKVYGAADPLLSASYSGLQYDDGAGVVSGLRLQSALGAAASAGSHPVTASGAGAANYVVSYRSGTLNVDQAPLLVVADNQSKVYGAADPRLSASFSGLQYSDSADMLGGVLLQTATGAAATAGSHPISLSGAAATSNYAVTYRPGTLLVARAPLLVTANDQSKVYGGADPQLSASYSGLQYSDNGSVLTGLRLQTAVGAAAGAGAHPISADGASAANYAIAYRPGTLNVTPAALTITANDASARYGEAAPVLSARYDGLAYGETPAVVSGLTLGTPAAAETPLVTLAPGQYPIVPANASAANYAISYVNGALQVGASPIALRPVIARDVTFESSYLYEKNVGTPRMCVGTGPLETGGSGGGADLLGLDWSRVRISPNLSNCLALGQRNSCSDF